MNGLELGPELDLELGLELNLELGLELKSWRITSISAEHLSAEPSSSPPASTCGCSYRFILSAGMNRK